MVLHIAMTERTLTTLSVMPSANVVPLKFLLNSTMPENYHSTPSNDVNYLFNSYLAQILVGVSDYHHGDTIAI